MSSESEFASPFPFRDSLPSLETCDRHLTQAVLSSAERAKWLSAKAQHLIHQGQQARAIACLDEALSQTVDPTQRADADHPLPSIFSLAAIYALRGVAHDALGHYEAALKDYTAAAARLLPQDSPQMAPYVAWVWLRHGHACRSLQRYSEALSSYDRVLSLDGYQAEAMSSKGTVLALLGQRREGLAWCERAVAIAPDHVPSLNNLGIALMMQRRYRDALVQMDAAIARQPDFNKAWHNRALALSRLGRDAEALDSVQRALALPSDPYESWYASAWLLQGFTQMKLGQFAAAIESCEQAQALQPKNYGAALYKLICLVVSGRGLKRLSKSESRRAIAHDGWVVVDALKYRLLAMAAVFGLLLFGSGAVFDQIRATVPMVFAVGIVVLIAVDLWLNRSRLGFVWQVYFQSGLMTYIRAIGIIAITLSIFALAEQVAPRFMLWGWADLAFGQSGNLIFLPFFQLFSETSWLGQGFHTVMQGSEVLLGSVGSVQAGLQALIYTLPSGLGSQRITGAIAAHATLQFNLAGALVIGFWLMLLLGIPFWARLEERIFRQGVNTWPRIGVRSTQFGLVHLIVGIPILAGFVLIVPGFLFACRYKYVRDRHFKRYKDPIQADEAGARASTADHSVYNALLVSLVALGLLANQMISQ